MTRVLVVDDNADAAHSLAQLITCLGHAATPVTNPRMAAADCEIAFIDLGMPGYNGFALAADLKRQHPGIFLIAVSGYPPDDCRDQTQAAGFELFLSKPVDLDLLAAILQKHVA